MIDEKVYTVNTTEELFNRFTELESELRSVKGMFQNQGMEVTKAQLDGYKKDVKRFKRHFDTVIEEGYKVINER